jgi:transcriptional regulator with XRE-family HTH domain
MGQSGAAFEDRYDTAWAIVAEYLYTCAEPPSDELLIGVGSNGVRREQRADLRSWGWTTADEGGVRATVGFETYWWQSASVTRSPEERIVDALALQQILPALADQDREVLVALAAHEYSIPKAARALDLTVGAMTGRVNRARDRFLALWHEHESPTRKWRRQYPRLPEERLKPCGTPSAYQRHIRHGEYACDECRQAYAAEVKQRLEQARSTGVGAALGARVRELRTGLGLPRAALALAARVSRTYVFELEHGGRVAAPNRDKVARLDTALGAAGELLAIIDETDGRECEALPAPVDGHSPVVINPHCQTGEYTEQLVRRIVQATNPMRGAPTIGTTIRTGGGNS